MSMITECGCMNRLSFLQREQVLLALDHGISRKLVSRFAKPGYNFLQMEQIRLYLEKQENAGTVSVLLNPRIPWRQMEDIRRRMERGESIRNPVRIPVFALLAASVLLAGFCFRRPSLVLTAESCTLKRGEPFDAMSYISSWSNPKGLLILPEGISTEKAGTQLAVYRLQSRGQEIVRTLSVTVE